MSHPSDQVMGATGSVTCVSPPHVVRLEGNSKSFTQHSSKICFLHCCCCCFVLLQGRETGPGRGLRPGELGTRERQCCPAVTGFYLLFWAGSKSQMFFKGEKKKEKAVPFCRTQGCPANMEFPLLSVTEQSGKGRNADHAHPMGKNYSKRFLYNMYRARCKPAPQIQNTTIFKKPTGKETGPWLHPTGVWEGILRLKRRVIL